MGVHHCRRAREDSEESRTSDQMRPRPVTTRARSDREPVDAPTGDDPIADLHNAIGNRGASNLFGTDGSTDDIAVSRPRDAVEREADQVATAVLQPTETGTPTIATSSTGIHRKAASSATGSLSSTTESASSVNEPTSETASGTPPLGLEHGTTSNSGRPLPGSVRSYFESQFGRSFSDVRIRTDAAAVSAADAIDAGAFTYGRTIAFNDGAYRPQEPAGRQLLAHELTHVVQQQRSDQNSIQRAPNAMLSGGAGGKTKAKTYPRIEKIRSTKVRVASKDEAEKARKIIKEIETTYDIDMDSEAGIKAIKKAYGNVPKSVTSKLKTMAWEFDELEAMKKALDHFSPILGKQRKKSNRSGTDQAIDSVSKVKQAIDENTKSGALDTTTLGEYFDKSDNLSLFKAGTTSTIDFSPSSKQLHGTAVHEIAHGVFEDKTTDWANRLDFWASSTRKSGKSKAEDPITSYGESSASEDLAEAVMYYFVDQKTLKKKCPERFKIVEEYVNEWTK